MEVLISCAKMWHARIKSVTKVWLARLANLTWRAREVFVLPPALAWSIFGGCSFISIAVATVVDHDDWKRRKSIR